MKALFNRLTSNWNLAALLLGLTASAAYRLANLSDSGLHWAFFLLLVVTVGGLLLRAPWARLLALVVLLALAAFKIYSLAVTPFTWQKAVYLGVIGFVARALWKHPDNGILDDFGGGVLSGSSADKEQGDNKEEADEPMITLIHLRRKQRYLEAPVLAHALSDAWDLNIVPASADRDQDDEETSLTDGFVAGDGPVFMVMVQKPLFAMFLVHNHATPYFDEPDTIAERVPNLRVSQVIREHDAWLSVDLMQVKDTQLDQDAAYRLIGKAISALADDDVMAILCPQHRFLNLWSSALETLLCGDTPLDALKEQVKAPVIGVQDGETIENAIAEARRRWPEFVATFKTRQPDDDRFIVKAPFTGENGEVEHMWLQVFGLEPDYIHGHLVNHPMHTTKLKQGSQVEVPVAELSDWVCPDAQDTPLGNFTQHAISQAAAQKRGKSE